MGSFPRALEENPKEKSLKGVRSIAPQKNVQGIHEVH